jgi:hypothetical protein
MITPSFSLDFTTAVLDSRVTFTRSGATATRVNSSGYIESVAADTARFDFSSVALVCKGLLIEEARQNLLTYSNDFNTAPWSLVRSNLTPNVVGVTSPDGAQNADKLYEDSTASSSHYITRSSFSVSTSTAYTVTVYAKAAERNFIALTTYGSSYSNVVARAFFNLSNGTTSSVGSGVTATISAEKDGWYRCSYTRTTTATGTLFFEFSVCQSGSSVISNGNGASGLYIYGAQLEAGAFATSYIPTTTTALTRNADVATITGTNFSDFWQAGKGGASVLATPSTVSGIRPLVQFDDNTANEIIALRGSAANPELQIVDGGAPQVQLDAGTIVANTLYSLTGWWQTNDCKARQNSGATVSDYTATIPTVTQARIGSDGTNYLNGTIATINYYDSFFGQPIYTRRKNKVFPSLL